MWIPQIDWCIRELLRWLFYLLSLNTKFRSSLKLELRLFVFCFHYLFITTGAKRPCFCGQHNEMIWRTFKFEMQNERDTPNKRLCSTEELHHTLWTLLSSFCLVICHVWVQGQMSSGSLYFRISECIRSQKTQSSCGHEFCEIVTFLANVFALFAYLSWLFNGEKNSRRTPKPKK